MAEYVGYFDDSGHPDDQDVVLVAGWVAKLEQWLLFEEGWKKIRAEFGVDSFHMSEYQAHNSTYGHLDRKDRIRLLDKLSSQIRTRAQQSFCSMVPIRDYREINAIYCLEEFLGKPYAIAGLGVVQKINAWKNIYAPDDPLVIVFEDGSKHKGDLRAVFKQGLFDEPIFRKRKDIPPLEGADMLAWECFNSFNTGHIRPEFERLLTDVPGGATHGIFTSEKLINACQTTNAPLREPAKSVAFYYTSAPKVRRWRQITKEPGNGQIRGADRTLAWKLKQHPPETILKKV